MSSDSSLNARASARLCFFLSSSIVLLGAMTILWSGLCSAAGAPYSAQEMRAVETHDEAKIRELREQEVTQLRIALGRRLPVHRLADLYFRLAELYLEAYREEFLKEGRVHDKRLEQRVPDPFIDRNHSKPFLRQGIKACQDIVRLRISYERMDHVYYFLGFNYAELDDKKASEQYYNYLVQHYPNSPFAGVAYKELAEYAYKRVDFRRSAECFENARQKMPPDTWPPILHRLAWTYYRLRNYDRAIAVMKESISSARQVGGKYLPLREEALQDLATLMAESGRADEAIAYFQEEAGDKEFFPKILEKLGRQYERNLELPQAFAVYQTLLKTHPKSHEAFRVLVKLLELDLKQKRYRDALDRLNALSVPVGGDTETQSTVQNLKLTIRKVATEHHQEFRKKRSANPRLSLEIAESFYNAYLIHFLKTSDPHQETSEIQMYLAEIKQELGRPREAVDLYRSVVKSKDSRYAKEASKLWIGSMLEAMKKLPPKHGEAASSPSPLEKEFVEAADAIGASLEGKESEELALRAAQVQAGYSSTHLDAVSRLRNIVSSHPKTSQAITAAQLWIQLCTDHKPHGEGVLDLSVAVGELHGNQDLISYDAATHHGKLKALLVEQESQIKVGRIAKQEHDQNYIAAAKGYEEFAKGSSDRELAEKAYAKAVLTYIKAAHSSEAFEGILSVQEDWNRRYPGSSKAVDPLRRAATNALIRGSFELSARLFGKLGTVYKDSAALETAARIFEANEQASEAQAEWSHFLELYPRSPRRSAVALALASSQEKAHLDGEANRSYRLCASGPIDLQAECLSHLADLYFRDQNIPEGEKLLRTVAAQKSNRKGEALSPFVGYARYKLAKLAQERVSFDPLKFPDAQLKKALGQRLNFLEPLSKAYQSAVQVGGPWAIAALNELALWAVHFADEVDAIEPPASLQGNALVKFKQELLSISRPLRDKAKSTWNESYVKATAVNLFSPVIPEVADHLADFRVQVPGRAQGPRGKFHLAGMPAGGQAEGLSASLSKVRDRLLQNATDATAWTDYGNLLWGQGKPLMAKIAFERATALNPKHLAALNNLGVVLVSEGEEDWVAVTEGVRFFEEASKIDDFYIPAKINLATIMNYYRFFAKAKLLWDQVLVRSPSSSVTLDAQDGLGIALLGLSNAAASEGNLKKATDGGAEASRFSLIYNEAARLALNLDENAHRCVSELGRLEFSKLRGFEKSSAEYLREKCEKWKKAS